MEDIAIVGVGCRFSGNATNPQELWSLLEAGESTWTKIPKSRFNHGGFYHPNPQRKGAISIKGAHFMRDDVAAFDPSFFDVAAQEAHAMDPQQRLLLEVVYEALESGGIPNESLKGTQTAVFVGAFVKDYDFVALSDPHNTPYQVATGTQSAILSNRISHWLDVHGPTMTIETGCSSSLIAIHQACQSLRTHESDIGIAGGVSLILTADMMYQMTEMNFLGPNGKCFAFSDQAEGYGRGEGCGVVVLKRFADAAASNDTIRGIIRGSAVNSNGRTPSITMPSEHAQVANIQRAYKMAGLEPFDTKYIECHGTGTTQGDTREAQAISMIFAKNDQASTYVGSVKTNLGHTEAAAGVAGVIKAILALEHARIPPHLNFTRPHPDIPLDQWNIKIPLQTTPWPGMTMRASINSFGFGGANAHVVIDGAVQYLEHRDLSVVHQNADPSSSAIPHQPSGSSSTLSVPGLFIYSAQDQKRVKAMLRDHASYLRTKSISLDSLVDYSYTLLCRRSRLAYSTAIIADSTASLLAQLGEADKLIITRLPGRHTKPRVGFVFCGQGACRSGMFEGLWHYKPFHESVQDACRFLNRLAPMLDFLNLFRSSWQDIFDSPVLAQTASTVFQVALVDFLAACSVEPMAVVGHSSGEIAAAYAARIVDRETAWLLAFLRGKAATTALPGGGMLAAAMSLADAQDVLARTKRDSSVTVGCVNSPSSVTFSGAKTTLKGLADDLKARKIRCTMLKVSVAYHSNCMEEPADVYYRAIPSYQLQKQSSIRMFSSVTGELIGAPAMTAEYWRANMVSPVLFDKALGAMMGPISDTTSSPDILVEISPSAVLRTPISQTLEAAGTTPADVKYLPMQDKSVDNKQPLKVLGELIHACYQVKMDWMQRSDGGRPKCLVDLPSYPWNHERAYWHEPQGTRALRQRAHGREDLIGAPSTHLFEQEPRWRGAFRLHENPWIKDHQVQRSVMYPAAGMAAMAIEGAKQMFERLGAGAPAQLSGFEVCDLDISAPILIPATQRGLDHSMTAQRVNPSLAGPEVFAAYQFSIFSRMDTSDWQKNAKGVFKLKTHSDGLVPLGDPSPNNVREISEGGMKSHHLYQRLDNIGMKYGPTFRAVTSVGVATEAVEDGVTTRSCMLRLRIPDTAKVMPFNFEYEHFIHPATLDAVIHSVFALDSAPMVPVHVDSIKIAESFPRNAGTELLAYCEATDDGKPNVMADVTVYDAPGASPVLTVRGLQLARLSPGAESGFLSSHRSLCSTVEWNMDPLAHLPAPNTKDFLAWLTSLLLKKPDLRILFAIEDTALAIEMLLRVTGGADRAVTCSRFTFTAVAQSVHDAVLADAHSRFQGVLPIIELSSGTTPTAERTGRYDLVVVGETHAQLLEPFLKAGGFVYHQQTQTVVAKQPSTDPVDKDTKLLVVLLVATDHKVKSEYEAILADVTAFVQSEHANSQVILTDDMNLESYSTQEVHVVSFLDLSKGHNVSLCADQYAAVQKLLLSKTYASMLWITHGAQMDCKNAGEATMIGIVRTIRSEDPGKKITCLDLDVSDAGEGTLAMDHVISLLRKSILSRHARGVAEPEAEYAVKHGVLHFARLRPVTALNRFIEEARYSGASTPSPFSVKLQGTGTYLIVGGLGGLGREIAKLLVARGARHLCFVSRRAVASSDEVAKLALWLGGTAKIVLYQADVCDAQQLRDVLDQMAQECPPLKGVIQAAAVVKDAMFGNITHDMFNTAYRPKATGTANLLQTLLPADLDFAILLSSAAGIIGNRAQAGYNAGNCVQDAMARQRTLAGAPTVALDLGPVIEVGILADDAELLALLTANGFLALQIEHVLAIFEWAVAECLGLLGDKERSSGGQIVAGVGTGGLVVQNKPADPFWTRQSLFAVLNRVDLPARRPAADDDAASSSNSSDNTPCSSGARPTDPAAVVAGIRAHLLSTGVLEPPHDALEASRSFGVQGVDSRAAAALASWILAEWGVVVTVGEILGEAGVGEIAGRVVARCAALGRERAEEEETEERVD